jgi:methionyl-tRNA formyltransferase
MNYETLHDKLAELAGDMLVETLPKFVREEYALKPQNEKEATYTKKFKTEDGYINPEDLEKAKKEGGEVAVQIERKIRALNPEPGTWTMQNGKRMKILEAAIREGKLILKKIQIEGKKPQEITV